MSHLVDIQKEVAGLKRKYALVNFIETGCCEGRGIRTAFDIGFKKVHSCDVNGDYVDMCRKEFPTANIAMEESVGWLDHTIPSLSGNSLFWLDAHFPDYFGHGKTFDPNRVNPFPIFNEVLTLIKHSARGVVLIDDVRCFPDMGRTSETPQHFHSILPFSRIIEIMEKCFIFDRSLLDYSEGIGMFVSKNLP